MDIRAHLPARRFKRVYFQPLGQTGRQKICAGIYVFRMGECPADFRLGPDVQRLLHCIFTDNLRPSFPLGLVVPGAQHQDTGLPDRFFVHYGYRGRNAHRIYHQLLFPLQVSPARPADHTYPGQRNVLLHHQIRIYGACHEKYSGS